MTEITERFSGFTMINTFRPPQGRMPEITALLIRVTEDYMRHVPGFVSANFHLSKDGTRLVNYVQWRGEGGFEAMFAGPEGRDWLSQVNAIGSPEVMACDAIYVSDEHRG